MYGLTAGSIIPLSIVYMMRPESLKNLFDLISSSLLIAFNWSEGVAQRFNLSSDLFFNNDINETTSIKVYSCYTIEYWYNIFSWIIYFSFILSLILFILNQRVQQSDLETAVMINKGDCQQLIMPINLVPYKKVGSKLGQIVENSPS
ncbi:unnamed protein product [Rotaria sp. Silwood2]|nr:unnamed protein product [Rotaria sp. Silwood2]